MNGSAPEITIGPITMFGSCFALSSLAGLAALLRSGKPINFTSILSAVTNAGILGIGIGLLWHNNYLDNQYGLIGLCCLSGLGSSVLIDFIIELIKSFLSSKFGNTKTNEKI